MKIAVVGGGIAAHEAAVAARAAAPEAEIAVFSAEKIRPYRRPMLSALLTGRTPDEKTFFIKPAEFYAENRIDLRLDCPVTAVAPGRLTLADGGTAEWDRLILATGGRARRLPLPVAPGAGMFVLRDYFDLLRLNAVLPECRRVVVIGGGVLGLEAADSLLQRGIAVTVLEYAPRLFPGKLPEDAAAALLERLNRRAGLTVRCAVSVAGISRAGALTDSGELIPADAALCAAGSAPDTKLAAAAGVAVNRGVLVDARMATNRERIFAAGDAAEFNGSCFGLYLDAMATGRVAGIAAAGGEAEYTPAAPTPARLNALGEKLILRNC